VTTTPAPPSPAAFPGLLENHAALRSRFGIDTDEAGVARMLERFRRPEWVTGSISAVDAVFLHDVIQSVRPRRIVEVGVASGCSSAALLMGLADAGIPLLHDDGTAALHGFDRLDCCFFDRDRALAAGAFEMVPDLVCGLKLHPGETALDASRRFAGEPIAFAFIDADHRHPFPTADMLALAPVLARGAWVALHDINLVSVADAYEAETGETVDWRARGAEILFERWPFEKIACRAGHRNIGIVRLPADRPLAAADLRDAIDQTWEAEPPVEFRRLFETMIPS
jgi:predicted O-methyltransferase YrrM